MSIPIELVRKAKEKFQELMLDMPEVIGIGIEQVSDGFGLKVLLRRKPRNLGTYPVSCHGVPVSYEVVGKIRALST